MPALLGPDPTAVSQLGQVVPQAVQVAQQKIPRSDRLEVSFMSKACFFKFVRFLLLLFNSLLQ